MSKTITTFTAQTCDGSAITPYPYNGFHYLYIEPRSAVYAYLATYLIPPGHHVSLMSMSTHVQQSSSLYVQDMPAASTSRTRKLPIGVPAMLKVTVSPFNFLLFRYAHDMCVFTEQHRFRSDIVHQHCRTPSKEGASHWN